MYKTPCTKFQPPTSFQPSYIQENKEKLFNFLNKIPMFKKIESCHCVFFVRCIFRIFFIILPPPLPLYFEEENSKLIINPYKPRNYPNFSPKMRCTDINNIKKSLRSSESRANFSFSSIL